MESGETKTLYNLHAAATCAEARPKTEKMLVGGDNGLIVEINLKTLTARGLAQMTSAVVGLVATDDSFAGVDEQGNGVGLFNGAKITADSPVNNILASKDETHFALGTASGRIHILSKRSGSSTYAETAAWDAHPLV